MAVEQGHKGRRLGEVYYHAGKMWRRGKGYIYAAKPADPIIERAYRKRLARRERQRGRNR